MLSSNLGLDMGYPGRSVSDFLLSLQTNYEIVPQLSHYRFLPNPFQLIYYHAIRRCIVSILKALLKKQPLHTQNSLQTVLLFKSLVVTHFVSYLQSKENCTITKWSVRTAIKRLGAPRTINVLPIRAIHIKLTKFNPSKT
jgi:hypothetical protein